MNDADSGMPKQFQSSLKIISTNHALRCDAKFADPGILSLESKILKEGEFRLGDVLPQPFTKGVQPDYLDQPTDDSIPVINTLSIQNLSIRVADCRHITKEDYEALSDDRKLRKGDVLLTVDGGVSIGKPALFDFEGPFTTDSHVVTLRPKGLKPLSLVYILASPLGQVQFRRAESGASGQTTVTEDDVRRFLFPQSILKTIDQVAAKIEKERQAILEQRQLLTAKEEALWKKLDQFAV